MAGQPEMENQSTHITIGHQEIRDVKDLIKETSNAMIGAKNIINELPSLLSEDQTTLIRNSFDFMSQRIHHIPDRLDSLLVARQAELNAAKQDRRVAGELLSRAEERSMVADSREKELVEEAEAFEGKKKLADARMKQAVGLFRAVENRENLVALRERKVGNLGDYEVFEKLLGDGTKKDSDLSADAAALEHRAEAAAAVAEAKEATERLDGPSEKKPLSAADRDQIAEERALPQELNLGADAALEDAAEAAAAHARGIERQKRLNDKRSTATAAENSPDTSSVLEKQPNNNTHPNGDDHHHTPDLLGPNTITAQEEQLWARETRLVSRELMLDMLEKREQAISAREQNFKFKKATMMQSIDKWKVEVDEHLEEIEGRKTDQRLEKEKLEVLMDSVWDLIEEARGLIRGDDGGEGERVDENGSRAGGENGGEDNGVGDGKDDGVSNGKGDNQDDDASVR